MQKTKTSCLSNLTISQVEPIVNDVSMHKILSTAEEKLLVANAATLQLAACCPNFCILEIMYSDVDYRKFITDENLEYENGRIKIGNRPGLGIELNEEECLKHPYVEHNLRHYTGALTDIRPAKTEFYF